MTIESRIREEIEGRIRSGEWRPGHRIPFEHELVDLYGCARATVNKALTGLSRAGLIERRRRAGSFVAYPQVRSAVLAIPDIGQMIAQRGDTYRYELTSQVVRTAKADAIDEAQFKAKVPLLSVEGLHFAAGTPFALEARLISLEAVPDARGADFREISPGSWLLDRIPWTDARHRISAIAANAGVSAALSISPLSPCLQVERWTWRQKDAVTFVRQIFPAHRYQLVGDFAPDPGKL